MLERSPKHGYRPRIDVCVLFRMQVNFSFSYMILHHLSPLTTTERQLSAMESPSKDADAFRSAERAGLTFLSRGAAITADDSGRAHPLKDVHCDGLTLTDAHVSELAELVSKKLRQGELSAGTRVAILHPDNVGYFVEFLLAVFEAGRAKATTYLGDALPLYDLVGEDEGSGTESDLFASLLPLPSNLLEDGGVQCLGKYTCSKPGCAKDQCTYCVRLYAFTVVTASEKRHVNDCTDYVLPKGTRNKGRLFSRRAGLPSLSDALKDSGHVLAGQCCAIRGLMVVVSGGHHCHVRDGLDLGAAPGTLGAEELGGHADAVRRGGTNTVLHPIVDMAVSEEKLRKYGEEQSLSAHKLFIVASTLAADARERALARAKAMISAIGRSFGVEFGKSPCGRYLATRMAQLTLGDSSLYDIKERQLRRRIDALDSHLGASRQDALNAVVRELKASGHVVHVQYAKFQHKTTRVRKRTTKVAVMEKEKAEKERTRQKRKKGGGKKEASDRTTLAQEREKRAAEKKARVRLDAEGTPVGMKPVLVQPFQMFWASRTQIEMLKLYGHRGVINMDGTHNSNEQRYELMTLMVIDGEGRGIPTAHGLLQASNELRMTEFLRWCVAQCGGLEPEAITIDVSPTEEAAIVEVFEDETVRQCKFHILQNAQKHVGKRSAAYKIVDALVSTTDKDQLQARFDALANLMVGMGLPKTKMMRENGLGRKPAGVAQQEGGRTGGTGEARGGGVLAGDVDGDVAAASTTSTSTSTSATRGLARGSARDTARTPVTPGGNNPGAGKDRGNAVGGSAVTVEDTTGSWATTDAVREDEDDDDDGVRDEDAVIDELVELMGKEVGLEAQQDISCDDVAFGKLLEELRAGGVCGRLKDLKTLLFGQRGMYKSRSRWALAFWRFLIHYTTNNHLESYHGTLKIARLIGAVVVRLHAVVRAIVAADKVILEGARKRVQAAVGYSKSVAHAWEKVAGVGLVKAIAAVEAERFPGRSLTFKKAVARRVSLKLKLRTPRAFEWGLLGACIVMGSTERHLQSLMISMATLREELEGTDVYAERTVAPEDPESGEWMVKGVYRVQLGEHAGGRLCTCPAFAGLGYICKHVLFVLSQVILDGGGLSTASATASVISNVLDLIPAEYFTPQTLINRAHDSLILQQTTDEFLALLVDQDDGACAAEQAMEVVPPSSSTLSSGPSARAPSGVVHGSPKKTGGRGGEPRLEHVLSSPASDTSRSSQRAEQRAEYEAEVVDAFTNNARLMRQLHLNIQNGSLNVYTDQELLVLCNMIRKTEMGVALATEDEGRGGRSMIRTWGPRSGRHGRATGSSSSTSSSGRKRKRSGPRAGGMATSNTLGDPLPPADVSGAQKVKKQKSSARRSRTTALSKVIG